MTREKPAAATPLHELPFTITDVSIEGAVTTQRGMIMTPKQPMVIGRERLEHLSQSTTVNPVERGLVEQARKRAARVVFMRAAEDQGNVMWQFDPSFSDDELAEAGYILSRAVLPLHRRFVAVGVMLMVHTEWGLRECYALREGVARLEAERNADRSPLAELDGWLLKNMLLHVSLGIDHVVETLLTSHITMIERRLPRVRELLARVPAEAVS